MKAFGLSVSFLLFATVSLFAQNRTPSHVSVERERMIATLKEINRWGPSARIVQDATTQLDAAIKGGADLTIVMGWGVTKDGAACRLAWANRKFAVTRLTREEAIKAGIAEMTMTIQSGEVVTTVPATAVPPPAAEPLPPPRSLPAGQEYEITDVKINDASGTLALDQPLTIRLRLYRSSNSRPRRQTFIAVDAHARFLFRIHLREFQPPAPGAEQPFEIEVKLQPYDVSLLKERAGDQSSLEVAVVTLSTAIGGEIVSDDISNRVKQMMKVLK